MNNRKVARFGKHAKDIIWIALLALALLIASWKIFGAEDNTAEFTSAMSDTEIKISRLLTEISGVGQASVMICETEEGAQSAVVVCEGAKDLQVIMDVREAVAAALGMDEKSVKIYLKKV